MHEWYEQIEQYLNGHMSPEEHLRFESEVAINGELYALLMVYKQIETDMRHSEKHSAEEAALKSTLQKLNAVYFNRAGTGHNTMQAEKPAVETRSDTAENGQAMKQYLPSDAGIKKINRWKIPAMAAAILGIISLGMLWLFNHQQSNRQVAVSHTNAGASHQEAADTALPNLSAPVTGMAKHDSLKPHPPSGNNIRLNEARRRQLFAANFKPDAVPADVPPSLQEPIADYEAARHQDALAGFDAADPGNATRGMEEDDNLIVPFYIHYYSAQSLMATGHVVKAVAELQMAMQKSPDRFYGIKVSWYLALAYLHNGDIKKARQLLQQVAADRTAGRYQHKAANLLTAMVI